MSWTYIYFDESVEEQMKALDDYHKADLLFAHEILEEMGPHALPATLSKPLGDGLIEFRLRGVDKIARIFYCFFDGKRVTYLHSFIKKTQKTPDSEMKAARHKLAIARDQEAKRKAEEAAKAAQAKKEERNARR